MFCCHQPASTFIFASVLQAVMLWWVGLASLLLFWSRVVRPLLCRVVCACLVSVNLYLPHSPLSDWLLLYWIPFCKHALCPHPVVSLLLFPSNLAIIPQYPVSIQSIFTLLRLFQHHILLHSFIDSLSPNLLSSFYPIPSCPSVSITTSSYHLDHLCGILKWIDLFALMTWAVVHQLQQWLSQRKTQWTVFMPRL